MGYNNGYDSGYSDCEAENRKKWEEAAYARGLADGGSGGSGGSGGFRVISTSSQEYSRNDDVITIDLSDLKTGEAALVTDVMRHDTYDTVKFFTLLPENVSTLDTIDVDYLGTSSAAFAFDSSTHKMEAIPKASDQDLSEGASATWFVVHRVSDNAVTAYNFFKGGINE